MPYSEDLAQRTRDCFISRDVPFTEKKMFGGLCFLVDGKMCIGIRDAMLMARIDPDLYEEALKKPGCNEMTFTGRPMKGYVYLKDEAIESDQNFNTL